MTGRSVVSWCVSRAGATDGYPFGPDLRVFKLDGRIPRQVIKHMLEASYRLVVDSMSVAQRRDLIGDGVDR